MLIIKLAWRNLYRHTRKTVLLAGLIILGMALLFTANAVFEGTDQGLRRSCVGSLTGDAVISEDVSTSYSIFGNEIPIVSGYESIEPLISHSRLMELLEDTPSVADFTSIVSAAASMSIGSFRQNVPLFGIDPDTYFEVCSDIVIEYGNVTTLADRGVFLNSVLKARFEQALGRELIIGEPVTFTMYVGNSFRVRSAPFAGVHSYPGSTEALDRVVLADLVTVRSLAGYTLGYAGSGAAVEEADSSGDTFDVDSLFGSNEDVTADREKELDLAELETVLSDTEERDALVLTDSGAWSFILLKAEEDEEKRLVSAVKKLLDSHDLHARYLSWRRAAGSTAMALFAVQSFFYVGLGFIAVGAILVIMNALVISVLERTGEIGTMRSLGASSGFIRKLFVTESLLLTLGAGILGIVTGVFLAFLLGRTGISVSNPLLVSLFGGVTIQPAISFSNVLFHACIALLVGALAWIYPVALAIRVQPLAAMNKG